MSKSWHVVNHLKLRGPMNQTDLWTHFKPSGLFRSRTNMKDVINHLRKRERLSAVGVEYPYSGYKDHVFMVTANRSNFMKKEEASTILTRRKQYSVQQKAFFSEIENAEKTLLSQYYATRPQLKLTYENKIQQKARSQTGLLRFRARKVKEAEALAAQKKEAREKKQEEIKKKVKFSKNGSLSVKDQKGTEERKIALEIRRVAGLRKSIAVMQAQMVAKGNRKAFPRQRLAKEREKAGPLGTPARDALEEALAKRREKRVQALKKWRAERALNREKAREREQAKIAPKVSIDKVIQMALEAEEVTAAPPSQYRQEAANKLKVQRELEKKRAEAKADKSGKSGKSGKFGKSKAVLQVPKPAGAQGTQAAPKKEKRVLTPLQKKNREMQKKIVQRIEKKMKASAKAKQPKEQKQKDRKNQKEKDQKEKDQKEQKAQKKQNEQQQQQQKGQKKQNEQQQQQQSANQ